MAAKLYYAYIALSRVFAEIFQKNFSPHGAHNPETRLTFVLHRVGQKQGDFKLPPFCFFAENDFESDFEIESENELKFKIGFESDFESDFESENDFMFHVKYKYNHKKPIYGQKIVLPRFGFVKNFFQKIFWRICRPSPKKKRLPEGSLA